MPAHDDRERTDPDSVGQLRVRALQAWRDPFTAAELSDAWSDLPYISGAEEYAQAALTVRRERIAQQIAADL